MNKEKKEIDEWKEFDEGFDSLFETWRVNSEKVRKYTKHFISTHYISKKVLKERIVNGEDILDIIK